VKGNTIWGFIFKGEDGGIYHGLMLVRGILLIFKQTCGGPTKNYGGNCLYRHNEGGIMLQIVGGERNIIFVAARNILGFIRGGY